MLPSGRLTTRAALVRAPTPAGDEPATRATMLSACPAAPAAPRSWLRVDADSEHEAIAEATSLISRRAPWVGLIEPATVTAMADHPELVSR